MGHVKLVSQEERGLCLEGDTILERSTWHGEPDERKRKLLRLAQEGEKPFIQSCRTYRDGGVFLGGGGEGSLSAVKWKRTTGGSGSFKRREKGESPYTFKRGSRFFSP